jgi:N-acetylglucosamine kinase-like BadF-type ATPase
LSAFVVGVDGGATHTRAVVLDGHGREVARTQGEPAVAVAADPWPAVTAVAAVCRDAARAAGVALPVRALWAGLSGAGREAARSAVELELGRSGVATVTRVGTDVLAAFHDAFGLGPGVLLIAGTGSIAWGRAEDGREGRVGGWGHHIGDEGSGYAIGVEALRRVAKNADGRGAETNLRNAILAHLCLDGMDDLVQWAATAPRWEVAALAPVVVAGRAVGDRVAGEILAQAVEELERHVLTILENLGPWQDLPTVALAGGLLRTGRPLRPALEAVLSRDRVRIMERDPDAALGAARLAATLRAR